MYKVFPREDIGIKLGDTKKYEETKKIVCK
jgi:hypothetical protein